MLLLLLQTALADDDRASPFDRAIAGYGELAFAYHDHGPDQTGEGGGPPGPPPRL